MHQWDDFDHIVVKHYRDKPMVNYYGVWSFTSLASAFFAQAASADYINFVVYYVVAEKAAVEVIGEDEKVVLRLCLVKRYVYVSLPLRLIWSWYRNALNNLVIELRVYFERNGLVSESVDFE